MAKLSIRKPSLARFSRDDRGGVSTLEFVVLMPLFFTIIFAFFEIGMASMRWVMLEHGVDKTMRQLRLNQIPATALASPQATHDYLREQICRYDYLFPNCLSDLYLELVPANSSGLPDTSAECVNRADRVDPLYNVSTGTSGEEDTDEIMYLRACIVVDSIVPPPFAPPLGYDSENGYYLVVDSAYVNEPF